jgi:hypothetical protein
LLFTAWSPGIVKAQIFKQSRLGDESQGTRYLYGHRAEPNSFYTERQMAKRSRPDGIFEFAVAWSASNYVAKLRASVLRAKSLKPLGHILDFATLRKSSQQPYLMR